MNKKDILEKIFNSKLIPKQKELIGKREELWHHLKFFFRPERSEIENKLRESIIKLSTESFNDLFDGMPDKILNKLELEGKGKNYVFQPVPTKIVLVKRKKSPGFEDANCCEIMLSKSIYVSVRDKSNKGHGEYNLLCFCEKNKLVSLSADEFVFVKK
jgi:hypothetical protein